MTESESNPEPTLVERWLQDQQEWQRTLFTYLDSMMKNDEFLMHMGNAMRGSLLAGKPYPTAAPPQTPAENAATEDRLEKVLFALHQLQGQVKDILMTLDEMRGVQPSSSRTVRKSTRAKRRASSSGRKAGKRRTKS